MYHIYGLLYLQEDICEGDIYRYGYFLYVFIFTYSLYILLTARLLVDLNTMPSSASHPLLL